MRKEIQVCALLSTISLASLCSRAQQPTPSKPVSERTLKAGGSFTLSVPLGLASSIDLNAEISYAKRKTTESSNPVDFSCSGIIPPQALEFTVVCNTTQSLPAGEYQSDGRVYADVKGERQVISQGSRFPIVTIIANPPPPDPPVRLPKILDGSLLFDKRESLQDGAYRAAAILDQLNTAFPHNIKNSKENRLYLVGQVEAARTTVRLTQTRYMSSENKGSAAPIFFQDFDRRLEQIKKELEGTPSQKSSLPQSTAPHLVLAQMPKTSDSVDASSESGTLDKRFEEFVVVLVDMRDGFSSIDTETASFTWSITTTPPGAEVWYSRLGEPEKEWAGPTDIKDAKIPYAIWTFRVDWNGCWQKKTVDPYIQNPVTLKLDRARCTRK